MKCYRTFFSGPFIASPDISCTAYTCPHLRHFKLNEAKGKVLTFLPQTHSFPCSCIWVGSSTLGRFLQPQTGCILDSLFLISNLIQSPSAIKYSSNPSALFCHCGHHPHLSRGGHNSLPPGFPLLLWHPSNPLAGMSSDLQTWTRHSLAWNHSPTSYCWFQRFEVLNIQHSLQAPLMTSAPWFAGIQPLSEEDLKLLPCFSASVLFVFCAWPDWVLRIVSSLFQHLCLIRFLRLAWLAPPHTFDLSLNITRSRSESAYVFSSTAACLHHGTYCLSSVEPAECEQCQGKDSIRLVHRFVPGTPGRAWSLVGLQLTFSN